MHAVESGVNWIDTGPTYGGGHSEELVGRVLRLLGSRRPFVFTKCGRHWDSPVTKPRSDLRPASIRNDCEASLRRLRVEAIELLQIHWPDEATGTPIEDSWGEMRRLVNEGKIRAAGVCNFDRPLLDRCEAIGHVDSLQTPLSLIARDSASELLAWCSAHGTAVLAYSPMQVGLLTDSFSAQRIDRLHPEDWRRQHPEFRSPRLERNVALRDALRPIAEAHGASVATIAVAWVLAWPGITGAIVGASTANQVDGWLPAGDVILTEEALDRISAAIETTGAGAGPGRPIR